MAKNLKVGDTVYVPRSLVISDDPDLPEGAELYMARVVERENKSAKLTLTRDRISSWVPTSKLSSQTGLLIIEIGDFETETILLDRLHKCILQYSRLLFDDSEVRSIKIRTLEELRFFWADKHTSCSNVLLLAHGSPSGIRFGRETVSAQEIVQVFEHCNPSPKEVVSLCCQTGLKSFAKEFSQSRACDSFVAPFHSIHGATAALFYSSLLSHRLLGAASLKVAFNHAKKAVETSASFRIWKDGSLQ
jgi:hypothetical protein